jgi:large subunit ribosomal protein L4
MIAQKNSKSITSTSGSLMQILSRDDFAPGIGRKISSVAFSTWVRQLLQNWRQGTVSCKGRADVSLSTKKPWKQKGTGRARAGSARSPLWRGGGVTFGPQPRTRTLKINKKLRKGVLGSLLARALDQSNVICLDWVLDENRPKTSSAYKALKQAQLHDKKLSVFLSSDDVLHYGSFINIPQVHVLSFDEINAYDLAASDAWVVLKKDLEVFKDVVSTWI